MRAPTANEICAGETPDPQNGLGPCFVRTHCFLKIYQVVTSKSLLGASNDTLLENKTCVSIVTKRIYVSCQ